MAVEIERSAEMEEKVHAGLRRFFSYFGKSPLYEVVDGPDCIMGNHGADYPGFHGVMEACFQEEALDRRIEEVIDYYGKDKASFMWVLCPHTDTPGLGERLVAHGLVRRSNIRGMAADLGEMEMDQRAPEDFEIKFAESREELETFFNLLRETSGWPRHAAERFVEISGGINAGPDDESASFLGYLGGEPVSTSMVVMGEGLAGLWWVSTAERARGRGIGTAMSLEPLRYAREHGCGTAMLLATVMGYPLYRRLGFQEHYGPEAYLWLTERLRGARAH